MPAFNWETTKASFSFMEKKKKKNKKKQTKRKLKWDFKNYERDLQQDKKYAFFQIWNKIDSSISLNSALISLDTIYQSIALS